MATERFTKDHEWIRVDGDVGTVGITVYAQGQLGDVVFVDMPEAGRKAKQGDAVAVVESVKAASDIFAPVTGEPGAPQLRPPGTCYRWWRTSVGRQTRRRCRVGSSCRNGWQEMRTGPCACRLVVRRPSCVPATWR